MDKVIILTGPTAIGKTDLSIALAKELNTEIISADSMQIYKHMDIGTAKINEKEKEGITHHMIDIISPIENFSVKEYQSICLNLIKDMNKKGRIPIVCGGTGLYINSIIYDLEFLDNTSDKNIRKSLYKIYEKDGITAIRNKLLEVDKDSYLKYHDNDIKRNIRALEYFLCSNKKFSDNQQSLRKKNTDIDSLLFVLTKDREELYSDIDRRVDIMIKKGLIDEVKSIIEMGAKQNAQSMQAIGYKEVLEYLNGDISYDYMLEKIKQHSRNYAKRQLTWYRKMPDKYEIDKNIYNTEEIKNKIIEIINKNWSL